MTITPDNLAEFLEMIPDSVLVVGAAKSILLANTQAEEMFGYARGGLENQSLNCLLPATKREIHDGHLAAYFANPTIRAMGAGLELIAQRSDGSEFPVDIMLRPIEMDSKRYALCAVRDITIHKQNEAALKEAVEHEQALARTDYTTGAANARAFADLVKHEINRLDRYKHPFTIAYLDLDNFKAVNDQFGHAIGDQVLRTVVNTAISRLRKTDFVSRLGGDEFAFLLTETDPETAQAIVSGVWQDLLAEMQKNGWPVTFSIGVLTCVATPESGSQLIRMADQLMYLVKNSGKNGVRYAIYPDRR
jgi:diguanylate cyclase (GGDEF)-like protein/PAS domain S-box-containing protein